MKILREKIKKKLGYKNQRNRSSRGRGRGRRGRGSRSGGRFDNDYHRNPRRGSGNHHGYNNDGYKPPHGFREDRHHRGGRHKNESYGVLQRNQDAPRQKLDSEQELANKRRNAPIKEESNQNQKFEGGSRLYEDLAPMKRNNNFERKEQHGFEDGEQIPQVMSRKEYRGKQIAQFGGELKPLSYGDNNPRRQDFNKNQHQEPQERGFKPYQSHQEQNYQNDFSQNNNRGGHHNNRNFNNNNTNNNFRRNNNNYEEDEDNNYGRRDNNYQPQRYQNNYKNDGGEKKYENSFKNKGFNNYNNYNNSNSRKNSDFYDDHNKRDFRDNRRNFDRDRERGSFKEEFGGDDDSGRDFGGGRRRDDDDGDDGFGFKRRYSRGRGGRGGRGRGRGRGGRGRGSRGDRGGRGGRGRGDHFSNKRVWKIFF